jgi:hypothetical protein
MYQYNTNPVLDYIETQEYVFTPEDAFNLWAFEESSQSIEEEEIIDVLGTKFYR